MIIRILLLIFFPPFAVIDKGCGSIMIVSLLTMFGWAPGIVMAIIILNKDGSLQKGFNNGFIAAFLLTFAIGFVALVLIYVLFGR